MVVRIPGTAETVPFSQPVATPDSGASFTGPPDEMQTAMARMQARDDAVFIATALADLTARQRSAALDATDAIAEASEDPIAQMRQIDGFSARFDDAFAADVDRLIGESRSLSGPRPSDEALELFLRRAQEVRQGAVARNARVEDQLRRNAQLRSVETAVDALAAAVKAEPDGLVDSFNRVTDLTGAAQALTGPDEAAVFDRNARAKIAVSAVRGLVAGDADAGRDALRSGAFDAYLDEVTRSRLSRDAESLSLAKARDLDLSRRRQATDEARQHETRMLAFLSDFRRGMEAGKAGYAEIDAAEANGTLTPARAAVLRGELERSETAGADQAAMAERVGRALRDGEQLDPANPKDRQAADLYYRATIQPMLADLPPERRSDLISDFVSFTGIATSGALSSLAGIVIAGEPADRVKAAETMTRLKERNGAIVDELPPDVVRHAQELASLAALEIPPEKAFERADRSSTKNTQLAFGPAAAVLPAIVGGADAAAVGQAILGGLAAMGVLSLGGDTPQDEATAGPGGDHGESGGSAEGEEEAPDSGQPTPGRLHLPEAPETPTPPGSKPRGRGRKADDSAKGERHGDRSALEKAEKRTQALQQQLEKAPNKKERDRIRIKMKNIRKNAQKSRKGTEHGRRGR